MTLKLYTQVALVRDVPTAGLSAGDVAVLVDFVDHPHDGEQGAVLEIFNALGESLDVVTVPMSAVTPLNANHIPTVRTRSA